MKTKFLLMSFAIFSNCAFAISAEDTAKARAMYSNMHGAKYNAYLAQIATTPQEKYYHTYAAGRFAERVRFLRNSLISSGAVSAQSRANSNFCEIRSEGCSDKELEKKTTIIDNSPVLACLQKAATAQKACGGVSTASMYVKGDLITRTVRGSACVLSIRVCNKRPNLVGVAMDTDLNANRNFSACAARIQYYKNQCSDNPSESDVAATFMVDGLAHGAEPKKADLVAINMSTGLGTVWPSNGQGLNPSTKMGGSNNDLIVNYADVTGDGKADIIHTNKTTGNNQVYPTVGTLTTGSPFSFGTLVPSPRWGIGFERYFVDMTGDGKADLVSRNAQNGEIKVFPSTGSGFGASYRFGAVGENGEILFGDVTGDGRADLIVRSKTSGQIVCYPSTNGGHGAPFNFGKVDYSQTWGHGSRIYLADINGDGKKDLVIWNTENRKLAAWTSSGNGLSMRVPLRNQITQEHNIRFADITGDGKEDLILHNRDTGDIRAVPSTGYALGDKFDLRNLAHSERWGSGFQIFLAEMN